MRDKPIKDPLFAITTPQGVRVRTTLSHWEALVTIKHPKLADKKEQVKQILKNPLEIRRSKTDPDVYLYYGEDPPYLICVVVRHLIPILEMVTTHDLRRDAKFRVSTVRSVA